MKRFIIESALARLLRSDRFKKGSPVMQPSRRSQSFATSLKRRSAGLLFLFLFAAVSLFATVVRAQTPAQEEESEKQAESAQAKPPGAPAKSIVRGRIIYDDTNRPVRRARVLLLKSDGGGNMEKTGVTNERGEFRIAGVAAGSYFVMVDAPGIITPISNIDLDEKTDEKTALLAVRKEFDEVSVNGTDSVEVKIRARRGGVITGRVTYADGDPAAGAQIIILRKKDNRLARFLTGFSPFSVLSWRTDDRGIYRLAGLPPGEYVVGAAEANTRENAGDPYADLNPFGTAPLSVSYYQNETSLRQATPVKIESGQETSEINITLIERASYTISGTVVARQGRSPVRARLTLQNKNEASASKFFDSGTDMSTDEQGRWTFPNVPDGSYVITADPVASNDQDPEELEKAAEQTSSGRPPATPKRPTFVQGRQEVTVSGGDLSSVVIEVSEGGRIKGTVLVEGSDKKFLQPINILLSSRDGKTQLDRYAFVQPDDGSFQVEQIPTGEFNLSVLQLGEKYYLKSVTANGLDLMREPVRIGPGTSIDNVRITISSDMATLQGRVVSIDDGKPVRGAVVLVVPSDAARWRFSNSFILESTDASGAFKIVCAPGAYLAIPLGADENLRAINEAFARARAAGAKAVTLQPNGRETIELVAPAERQQ